MAVSLLGASAIFTGTVGNGVPFTFDYVLPDFQHQSDDRLVVVEIFSTTGLTVPLVTEYGGITIFTGSGDSTFDGAGSPTGKWLVYALAFQPGGFDFTSSTFSLTSPQASTAKIAVRFVVYQGADQNYAPAGVDNFANDPNIVVPVTSIPTSPLAVQAGGMLHTICAAATEPTANVILSQLPRLTTSDTFAVAQSGFAPTTGDGNASITWSFASSLSAALTLYIPPNTENEFNCDCDSVSPYDTLLNVRKKMLIRLGYPNQLVNPPPGMPTLIDQYLRDAQDELYVQLQRASLRTQRFFRWTMVPGQRYYNLSAEELACTALDPYKITWVGFEDLNQAWYRLDEGIPPEYYTRANINFGWPTRFEIRSCIEIFPAPQAAYTLWIKGDFGLAPLVADTDRFTIDDKMVFLLALGNMKADRGAKDAQIVLTQAANYVKGIVAGTHGTRRYVPRTVADNPLTPPKFLPLGNEPS